MPQASSVKRSVYFVSLGCPKNLVDSEVMLGRMDHAGHRVVEQPEEADVIVVNTCGFIDAAKEESVNTILEMAEHKSGRCEKLVVTGCLTQRHPDEIAREIPEIDHLLGSADYTSIAEIVAAPKKSGKLPVIQVTETPQYLYDHTDPRVVTGSRHSTYVKIAEGCDRPCSFCIIPKLRGPQRSRSIDSVEEEVRQLVGGGVREINLVAQDLTQYGSDRDDEANLARLLKRVARVPNVHWVRLHYTYPTAFPDELIAIIAEEPTVCKYIDVPLQHIDDAMLKRMRRGHTARTTHELIERLRSRIEGLVLRTTFIVGHPGETPESFVRLCEFVGETEFDHVGVFPYSREDGTVSALLPGRVDSAIAQERQQQLMTLQRGIVERRHGQMKGREIEVLVDGLSADDLLLLGRWYGQAPEVDGSVILDGAADPGQIVRAEVCGGSDYDLVARVLDS